MNPFDLKSALLARHAQHVVLIHFPIALVMVGVASDVGAQWGRKAGLAAVAYYNLLVAAIAAVPVLVTGILAWRWQLEGQRLHGTLLLHLVLGSVSTALILLTGWIHFRARRKSLAPPKWRFPVEFLAVAVVALTAHLGGFLTGVNGGE